MEKIRKTFLLFLLMMFLANSYYGQEVRTNERSSDGWTCSPFDKLFLIDGKTHYPENKIFICESLLPLSISLVTSTGVPIADFDLVWHYANNPTRKFYSSTLTLSKSRFINNQTDIIVTTEGREYKLTVSLDIDYRGRPGYVQHGYDDNKISQYWPSATNPPNTPWVFAMPSKSINIPIVATNRIGDTLIMGPNKFYEHIRVKSSNASITLDHDRMLKRYDDFIATNTGIQLDSINLSGCTTNKNIFLFTKAANVLNVPIKFIRIGETDDDEINYCKTDSTLQKDCITKISSVTHKCILEGPDGSYEEGHKALTLIDSMYNKAKYFPSWVSQRDSIAKVIVAGKNEYHIVAGLDKVCNTKPLPRDTFFDPKARTDTLMSYVKEANKIYNNYGVNLTYDGTTTATVLLNYDLWDSDNVMDNNSVKPDHMEIEALRLKLWPYKDPLITTVVIIKEHSSAVIAIADFYYNKDVEIFSEMRGKDIFDLALKFGIETKCIDHGDMAGGGNLGINVIEYIINPMIKSVGGDPSLSGYLSSNNYKNRSVKPTSSDPCIASHEVYYGELIKVYKEGKIVLKEYGEE